MRWLRGLEGVALALLAGGIAGVGLCASVLFARAPSREIAGQIGTALFGRLGPAVLLLAGIVLVARLVLRTVEPASRGRAISLVAAAAVLILAAFNALWLTPRMAAIWAEGAHAADGSGLAGEDRRRFLMLHGLSNLDYLAILSLSILLVARQAAGAARRAG